MDILDLLPSFEINSSSIWDSEYIFYMKGESSEIHAGEVIERMNHLLFRFGTPSFSLADQSESYAEQLRREYAQVVRSVKNEITSDFFLAREKLYEYRPGINVDRLNDEFDFWFTLKLRQYKYGLKHLPAFLDHQLKANFDDDIKELDDFLEICFLQYDGLLDPRIKTIQSKWRDRKAEQSPSNQERTNSKTQKKEIIGNLRSFTFRRLVNDSEFFAHHSNSILSFFKDLQNAGFIDPSSNYSIFKKVFSNASIQKEERLRWIGANGELKSLVDYLLESKMILGVGKDKWVVTINCFQPSKGGNFEIDQLRKSKKPSPERTEQLKKILADFEISLS